VSVLCDICEFGASGIEFRFQKVMLGYLALSLLHYAARLLSYVDNRSFSFSYALNLV
jgi:hypothetical protein